MKQKIGDLSTRLKFHTKDKEEMKKNTELMAYIQENFNNLYDNQIMHELGRKLIENLTEMIKSNKKNLNFRLYKEI